MSQDKPDKPDLVAVRARIDGIDRQIQALIAEEGARHGRTMLATGDAAPSLMIEGFRLPERDWSLEALAGASGVSRSMLSEIEREQVTIHPEDKGCTLKASAEGKAYRMGWSRYMSQAEGDAALATLAGGGCDAP